jgi:hypothetical protein
MLDMCVGCKQYDCVANINLCELIVERLIQFSSLMEELLKLIDSKLILHSVLIMRSWHSKCM